MELFAAAGETSQLMRAVDWAKHPLGPPEHWASGLRTIVPILLASSFPMRVLWGRDMVVLYNDAYRPVLGEHKHPAALGRPMREAYAEIWEIVGPMFERALAGETLAFQDLMLPLVRAGYREEAYFTLSYSPMPDDDGGIGGVLGVVYETTERVLAERRLRTLRDLSGGGPATTARAACADVAAALNSAADVPFAQLSLVDDDSQSGALARGLTLVETVGVAPDRTPPAVRFPRRRAVIAIEAIVVAGPYPEPVTQAFVITLNRTTTARPCAQLVLGINPRRAFDRDVPRVLRAVRRASRELDLQRADRRGAHARAAGRGGGARGCGAQQPREGRVPRDRQPRAPQSTLRHPRLDAADAAHRRSSPARQTRAGARDDRAAMR